MDGLFSESRGSTRIRSRGVVRARLCLIRGSMHALAEGPCHRKCMDLSLREKPKLDIPKRCILKSLECPLYWESERHEISSTTTTTLREHIVQICSRPPPRWSISVNKAQTGKSFHMIHTPCTSICKLNSYSITSVPYIRI